MSRGLGLLQLARELEATARVVGGILRAIQGHAAPARARALPARPVQAVPVGPVKPGEVRRVAVQYIPPGKLKRKRK